MQRLRVPLLEATRRTSEARPTTRVLRNERYCRELVVLGRSERLLQAPAMASVPVALTAAGGGRSRAGHRDLADMYL